MGDPRRLVLRDRRERDIWKHGFCVGWEKGRSYQMVTGNPNLALPNSPFGLIASSAAEVEQRALNPWPRRMGRRAVEWGWGLMNQFWRRWRG